MPLVNDHRSFPFRNSVASALLRCKRRERNDSSEVRNETRTRNFRVKPDEIVRVPVDRGHESRNGAERRGTAIFIPRVLPRNLVERSIEVNYAEKTERPMTNANPVAATRFGTGDSGTPERLAQQTRLRNSWKTCSADLTNTAPRIIQRVRLEDPTACFADDLSPLLPERTVRSDRAALAWQSRPGLMGERSPRDRPR